MEDPVSQPLVIQFLLLVVLTLLNAFSASEMALVSLNRSRVEQKQQTVIKIRSFVAGFRGT